MKKFILALDAGTTSARALVFDGRLQAVSSAQREFRPCFPRSGWVEYDPMELWATQYAVMTEAVNKSGADPREIAAIGLSSQRGTAVLWDRRTGLPVCSALAWQDRRTAPAVDRLSDQGLGPYIRDAAGLVPDASYAGTKIKWMLDNVPGARARAEQGELLSGTVDTWLIWKLTEGRVHATDYTSASRTMLFNLNTLDWDDHLLQALEIPRVILPDVCPSSHFYGHTSLLGAEIPIAAAAGDQQASLFGQGCRAVGYAAVTCGTGCSLLFHTGPDPVRSRSGLLTTMACSPGRTVPYALEGSVFAGGALVQWLRDEMKFFAASGDSEAAARSVPDTDGVYVVPSFTGIGAPYWDMYARGCIVGLSRGTKQAHIARAALESIAYQISDLMDAVEKDTGLSLPELKAGGAAAANDFLMQFLADILGKTVCRPPMLETSALGAACLAGLSVGMWKGTEALAGHFHAPQQRFEPAMEKQEREDKLYAWHMAVGRSLGWAKL